MKKILSLFALVLLSCMGAWAQNVGPFAFTNWLHDSFTRVGGAEGNATYSVNPAVCLEQQGVQITNAGDLTVTFTYTNGDLRLEIYGVDLINEATGNVVYSNYAFKFAGGNKQGQVYTLAGVEAGTYTLRCWSSVWGQGNQLFGGIKSSKGNIVYSGAAAEGVSFTYTTWDNIDKLSDWKEVVAVPADVKKLILTANFKNYGNIHYHDDADLLFESSKSYNIKYSYTGADGGGNERMDIRGVEVLDAEGNVVAHDYHEGFTGNLASNRDYKVTIPAGTYTVRTLVQTSFAGDVRCKGNITYSVVDGAAFENEYNTNIKPNLYDNGVLKIGAPSQSVLTALEEIFATGNDFEIEAAYNAAMTTNNLNLPSGYYYMKNMDLTSGNNVSAAPYAYNDYSFNGNSSHKTLMTASIGANNTIWKVTNNGATISIVNGDGKGINNGTSYSTLNFGNFKATQFVNWGAKGIYFTQGLHASNQAHLKINGVVALTNWAHDDSKGSTWEFIPLEDSNIYNVVVEGADGYVALENDGYAYNGGFFNAANITKEQLTAQEIAGFKHSVKVEGNTITVTYTYASAHPYLVFKCERGGISANATQGKLNTPVYNEEEATQKFLLVTIEGKDYLYNNATRKFVTSPASGINFALVDYPHHAFTTAAATSPQGDYNTILKINGATMNNNNYGDMVNGWEEQDPGNRFQINEVGGISDEEYDALVASVKAACDAKKADMKTVNEAYSSALGRYTWAQYEATTAAVTASQALDVEAENYYTSLFAEIRKFDIAYQPTLNMPEDGTFLRMKSNVHGSYITIPAAHNTGVSLSMSTTANADNIFYYKDSKLLAYGSGFYGNNNNHAHRGYSSTYTFSASQNGVAGTYSIKPSGVNYWYSPGTTGNVNNWSGGNHANCNWILEAVESLPVTFTDAGYATLYAPVALTIPENVTAYTLTLSGEYLHAEALSEKIPANTAVVLAAEEAGVYNFAITTSEEFDGDNVLLGTVPTIAKIAGALVLGMNEDDEVGFYSLKDEVTTLAGFKAYYLATAGESNLRIAFDNDVITSILSAAQQNGGQAIYDLQGRRVVSTKGITVQNGKKVIK